jgi:hypothetical protein
MLLLKFSASPEGERPNPRGPRAWHPWRKFTKNPRAHAARALFAGFSLEKSTVEALMYGS